MGVTEFRKIHNWNISFVWVSMLMSIHFILAPDFILSKRSKAMNTGVYVLDLVNEFC